MIEVKKYCCIIRTYITDLPEVGFIVEDKTYIFQTDNKGEDSSIVYGNDVIEIDYFDNETELEARNEYVKLLKQFGSEVRN